MHRQKPYASKPVRGRDLKIYYLSLYAFRDAMEGNRKEFVFIPSRYLGFVIWLYRLIYGLEEGVHTFLQES